MSKFRATIQYPKTPKLRIFKSDDGSFLISYGDNDPLGVRSVETNSLDKEMQRLFGYSGWQEYKEKNAVDLKKDVKRDENGRITQAPTVHPIHVAYGLEEFFNNFDPNQYEVVGIPKGLVDSNIKYIKATMDAVDLRDSFFGNKNRGRFGIINIAMFTPEEGLENRNIIKRAKDKYGDFEKFFSSEFSGVFTVRHPNGGAWKANAEKFNQFTTKADEALTIDVKAALANSSLLNERKDLDEGFIRDFVDWALDGVWTVTKFTLPFLQDLENWAGADMLDEFAEAFKIFDPTGVTNYPDLLRSFDDIIEDPTNVGNYVEFGFNALACIPIAKYAVKADKLKDVVDKVDDLARIIRRAPGNRAANKKLGRDMQQLVRDARNIDPTDIQAMKSYSKKIIDMSDNVALSSAVKYNAKAAAKKIDDVVPSFARRQISRYRYRALEVGADYLLGDEQEEFPRDESGLGGGDWDEWGGGSPGNDLPDTPISIKDMQYFILPKNWRSLGFNWLTRQEKILAQRVGANSQFSMKNFEPEVDQDNQQSLQGANFLIFGHSQANFLASTIRSEANTYGAKVSKHTHAGNADGYVSSKNPGLVNYLKDIPSGKYSHAYLFLGGNTSAAVNERTLMANAKKEIVSYMTNTLKIPKRNILVILPPINTDNEYSRSRKKLNEAAASIFRNIGVRVHPQIIGSKKDFQKDGFHINGSSKLAKNSIAGMFSSFGSRKSRYADADNGVPVPYSFIMTELGYSRFEWNMYRIEIGAIESGNNYSIKGGAGNNYDGRYQMYGPAKAGGARRFGIKNPGHSPRARKMFRGNPALQEKLFAGFTVGNHKLLMKNSKKYRNASKQEKLAILGYAHNQGHSACAKWLRTGIVGRDAFGTAGTKYYYAIKKGFNNLSDVRTTRKKTRRRRRGAAGPSIDISSITKVARENNMKYFGNASGKSSGKFKSTYNMSRPTVQKVARALGHIPYSGGGWFSSESVSSKWFADNIIVVSAPIAYAPQGPTGQSGRITTNKHVAPYLLAAIRESRSKYGLPISHIGSQVTKGKSSGFSAHTWGAAIDLDSVVNPYTVGGLLSISTIRTVLRGGNYRRYWNFRNSRGRTYKNYLQECLRRGRKAISLYEFVAGPLNNNGIGKIFNKYGFRWGADWKQARKDVMHFEFMPHYVRSNVLSEGEE